MYLGLRPEGCAFFDGCAQDVAGGEVHDAVSFFEEFALGALACFLNKGVCVCVYVRWREDRERG